MRKGFQKAKAKHGVNKTWDLRQIWSHFGGQYRREREGRGKERRRRRRRREKKEDKKKRYGTMSFSMDIWNFKALYG